MCPECFVTATIVRSSIRCTIACDACSVIATLLRAAWKRAFTIGRKVIGSRRALAL
jgi:hypothetical protein